MYTGLAVVLGIEAAFAGAESFYAALGDDMNSAVGMASAFPKREFGDEITFRGHRCVAPRAGWLIRRGVALSQRLGESLFVDGKIFEVVVTGTFD